jgi:oxygen-independent coproporphyrinogen-3 oxidase
MTVSAYIHIPFCSHKCDFCDFAAFAGLDHLAGEYCQIVEREIEQRLLATPVTESLCSIFFGGGTPGLIDPSLIASLQKKICSEVSTEADLEVTLETTPHAISLLKAKQWLDNGINRLSIGVESFIDEELQGIGRDHNSSQAFLGIEAAIDGGFENISCDLMYALPNQTLASWTHSLEKFFQLAAKNFQIRHLSAYGLALASNSPLFSKFPKNSKVYPSDEIYSDMYSVLVSQANKYGFEQYEISNFSRPGWQSRHNLSYWNNQDYLAFGVGAHRFIMGERSSNWRSLAKYMQDPLGSEFVESITEEMAISESIMLSLRKSTGLNLTKFANRFGFKLEEERKDKLALMIDAGLVEMLGDHLMLTQKGIPISSSIMAELI